MHNEKIVLVVLVKVSKLVCRPIDDTTREIMLIELDEVDYGRFNFISMRACDILKFLSTTRFEFLFFWVSNQIGILKILMTLF